MIADIAVAERAEDRIGQRVKSDIGIAMAFKPMTMLDFYPADPQRLAGNKAVDVISQSDRGSCHGLNPQQSGQDRHILGISQFVEPRVARDRRNMEAQTTHQLRIIGRRRLDRCDVRAAQCPKMERLRGLNAHQRGAIDDIARLALRLLDQRIGNRQRRDRGVGHIERGEEAIDDFGGYAGPRGIVDQHGYCVVAVGQRGQRVGDRLLPFFRGTGGNPAIRQCTERRHDVIIADDDAASDRRVASKGIEAPAQDLLAAEHCKLLGHHETGAAPSTAREQYGHRARRGEGSGLSHVARPLAQRRLAGKRLSVYGLLKF